MGSLGRRKGFGQILGFCVSGFAAWWLRRTYYLLQIPGWSSRFRVVIEWTFALLFTPDIVKIDVVDEKTASGSLHNAGAAERVSD